MFGAKLHSTKSAAKPLATAKPSLASTTPTALPSVDDIVKAVIAALSAKPSTVVATQTTTAKPSKQSGKPLTKGTPTAKPSKKSVKAKATAKPSKGDHDLVPRYGMCCAVSLGADKSTEVDFDNAVIVAEALRSNHPDREWTGIGGLKTAVRQLLRASGTLTPVTLNTAWKAVRTEARKQGFSA